MNKYTADFETAIWLENKTYVWAWAICSIDNENKIEYGNNIDEFMRWCYKNRGSTVYFHNMKFDGEFLIYWLLKHGYKHVEKENVENNTFTTLISNMSQFYSITVYYKVYNKRYEKITFIDSLKIIPFSVEEVAKCFDLPISKLKIDYGKERPEKNYIMTKEEKAYIKNDVLIMAKALELLFNQDLTKMTQGSNAVCDYKKTIKNYSRYFPELDRELDAEIRKRL